MGLIYITGAPGSGKTTIQRLLTKHGIECYDIDDPLFGGPHNKVTGKRVMIPPADERSADWFDHHEWRIYPSAFTRLKEKSNNKEIVICGVAEADTEIINIFDKVLYLHLDDETLKERLLNRADNDYGKNPSELEEIFRRKHELDRRYISSGAIIVDASSTLDKVIEKVIAHIDNKTV